VAAGGEGALGGDGVAGAANEGRDAAVEVPAELQKPKAMQAVWDASANDAAAATEDEPEFMPFKQEQDAAVRAADPEVWRGGGEVSREMKCSVFDVGDHLALREDGVTLIGHGANGNKNILSVYDIVAGTTTQLLSGHSAPIQSVAVHGNLVASGDNAGHILLWSLSDSRQVGSLQAVGNRAHNNIVYALAIDEAGGMLVSGAHDNVIKLWDLASKTHTATLVGHRGGINGIHLTGDGALVSGGQDREARVWLLDGSTSSTHVFTHPAKVYNCCAAGDVLATACMDGRVRTFSRASNALTRELPPHRAWANTVRILGNLLVSGSTDATVRVWSLATPRGELVASLEGHNHMVLGLAISHTNGLIVSMGQDGKVFVWKPSTPS